MVPRVGATPGAAAAGSGWRAARQVGYAAAAMQPNPPRGITIAVAIVLLVIGAILALPIAQAVNILDPLATAVASLGVKFDRQLGYILLLAGDALLILGSLVRGL
jgi:hypothetical protein